MSNLYTIFDTETTGLVNSKLDLAHPSQPHLVALSALQVDMGINHIQQSTSKVVTPYGWEWDDTNEAFKVHGLTAEYCALNGRDEKHVLDEILHLWNNRSSLVAHNLQFDKNIISIAIARYYPKEVALLSAWREAPGVCTMKENKERVNAQTKPNIKTGKTRLKFPNLKETYNYFFDCDFDNSHSANADAVAVYQIFCAMPDD